ncbi:MAG: T9SS type A sorting domain-containing protein, partial [Bacteroidota bacterium]
LEAQITIDQNDMPSPGDTIRVSYGLVTAAIDPVPTGANFTWDFSQLQWIAQNIDTFLTIAQTSPTYQVVYADVSFNPNRANVATRGNFAFPPIAGIQVSDVYDFFYKSSSQYRRVGYGANVNGFDTPLPMNNFDILYNLPLNYNDNDSCDADFSLTLPSVLYYGYSSHRVNLVDGWGTLITPFGTFNTLRVKSAIVAHDSINLLATGFGFGIDRPLAREYKWIGNSKSIPLLQINTTDLLGTETVTSIVYQDSIRVLPTGISENINQSESFNVYPNPAKDNFIISMTLKNKAKILATIYNSSGEKVKGLLDETLDAGEIIKIFNNRTLGLSQGVYVIHAMIDGKNYYQKLTITK